ncbi:hypothetical protein AWC38_SpisGene18161 [Stylophora pistillata]|uniref:Uncharacterized protein n=2 Tax=Stylophora pistillata TaxID=50429 RepID=A0A2B4RL30_STYPI|nr:hypothetical protein AWC38_SpisGene18161 [Stylophora pistillata]
MSSQKVRQGPSPPSVEQILEDLAAASDDDVVFKSSIVAGDSAQMSKGKGNKVVSHSDNVMDLSAGGDTSENKGNADELKTKSQSNEELYGVAASFLKEFRTLESSQECLNSVDQDLKSKKEELDEAITKVKEAWEVEKPGS